MTRAEARAVRQERRRTEWRAFQWRKFGEPCRVCGRIRDEDGRPLYVAARRRPYFYCLSCWVAGKKLPRKAAA